MKTLISIFILPQEIDDLERTLIQLKNSSKYLTNTDIIFDISINVSEYLTDWSSSYIPKQFFIDKFNDIVKYVDWSSPKSKFNIVDDESIMGCVSQRRVSWLTHQDVDNILWLDVDLIFDERTLFYILHTATQIENELYVITPQTVKLWDHTWDCLVNDMFKDKPYGYEKTGCDPFIDSGIKDTPSVNLMLSHTAGQPVMKFAGGWFTLISKKLLDLVKVPKSFGHYGLEDTFIMWATHSKIPSAEQFILKNVVVCEDYKYRNRKHYLNYISPIDRRDEFLKLANSNFTNELMNLKIK